MPRYKQTNRLSRQDAAYIAGLIDGEGTIALTRRHRNENRQLEISVSSTEFALLDFVLERVGAGRISRKKRYSNQHACSAAYVVSNRQAFSLLEQIQPDLRSYEAKRGRLVLDHYTELTPRNGKYTVELSLQRTIFLRQFAETRARTYQPPVELVDISATSREGSS